MRNSCSAPARSGLSGRPDDLVGLVAFGGFADSKCPLTLDHGALVDIVQGLEIPRPIRDSQGRVINAQALKEELATAIGDGVAVAVDRLRGAKAKSKVLILLTDGDCNAGVVDPREAARIAAGIGDPAVHDRHRPERHGSHSPGRRIRQPGPGAGAVSHRRGAAAGDGPDRAQASIFTPSDSEGLAQVYAEIDKLEKSEFEETKYSEYTELFPWFAGPGLALILSVGVLMETRFRSLP